MTAARCRAVRGLSVAAAAAGLLATGCATPSPVPPRALLWEQLMAPPAGYAADLAARADLATVTRAEARYHRAHGGYAPAATLFDRRRPLALVTAGTRIRLAADPAGFCAEATGETSTAVMVATATRPAPTSGRCPSGGISYAAPDDEPGPIPTPVLTLPERDYLTLVVGIRTVLVAAQLGHPAAVPARRDRDATVNAAGVSTAVTAGGCVALTSSTRPGLVFYARPTVAARAVGADHRDVAELLRSGLRLGTRADEGSCGHTPPTADPPLARAMTALDALTPPGSPLSATRVPTPPTPDRS